MQTTITINLIENFTVDKYYLNLFRRVIKSSSSFPTDLKIESGQVMHNKIVIARIDENRRMITVDRKAFLNEQGLNPFLQHTYLVPNSIYRILDGRNEHWFTIDNNGVVESTRFIIKEVINNIEIGAECDKALLWLDGDGLHGVFDERHDCVTPYLPLELGGLPEWINFFPISYGLIKQIDWQLVFSEMIKRFTEEGHLETQQQNFYYSNLRPDRFTIQINSTSKRSFDNLHSTRFSWSKLGKVFLLLAVLLVSLWWGVDIIINKSNSSFDTPEIDQKVLHQDSVIKEEMSILDTTDFTVSKVEATSFPKLDSLVLEASQFTKGIEPLSSENETLLLQLIKNYKSKKSTSKIFIESNFEESGACNYVKSKKNAFLIRSFLVKEGVSIEQIKVVVSDKGVNKNKIVIHFVPLGKEI